ncbi:ABC-transporter substrate-binding protein [Planktothrix agardhii CCAP 1459/11A]|uniref:ABC-transporter substrate-binding protein n=1 Tax=Planktothrix agardhii CCAP 1459/11A TaxID=282420 RepID=A0A479ZRI7_PLAAG|nr:MULTISPECIES: ABC transporter substrate-binding protein [Planktothrix]GCL34246.1 ABC-transporter substrate-binding protein [Planktothrix agardhii CCAP 1459/11A]CAD5942156.1 Taurine-binding periplasmic protein [Planktothrix rubescens]CAH2571411.1 Taurine-binding periplasmic protein [Planktothrix rubescens]
MKRRKILSLFGVFVASLALIVSCNQAQNSTPNNNASTPTTPPLIIGYSNWSGWWPWAIAESEGLFKANGLNVELKWFDGYLESLQAMAAGQLDGNCQTLNDTIAFVGDSKNGQVAVLINDNSAGNDKIIVAENINKIQDLKAKKVAVEEGLVDDFLLALALEKEGMSRQDVEIVNLETGAASAAFVAGQVDAVGAFPPFWLTALQRKGSKELISSKEFPGAIPDLLVVSQKLIQDRPEQVQGLVKTWFDIREFMAKNPEKANEIMAKRAGVSGEEFKMFNDGTKFFTIQDNLEAFNSGNSMKYLPFAAKKMSDFMLQVGLLKTKPNLEPILDAQFVKKYAETLKQ